MRLFRMEVISGDNVAFDFTEPHAPSLFFQLRSMFCFFYVRASNAAGYGARGSKREFRNFQRPIGTANGFYGESTCDVVRQAHCRLISGKIVGHLRGNNLGVWSTYSSYLLEAGA